MSIVSELLEKPGVISAGVYTYKEDISSHAGNLTDEQARLLAIMCYCTTKGVVMQNDMLAGLGDHISDRPPRGWVVRGRNVTLLAVANVFCVLDNGRASVDRVVGYLRQTLADKTMRLV